jgi:hypothetical protein
VVRNDHRQDDEGERIAAGKRREMPHPRHDQCVDEQAKHDRRRRQQDVVDEAHDPAQPRRSRVFGKERSGQDSDRRTEQLRQARLISTLPKRALRRPPAFAGRRRHLREQAKGGWRRTRCASVVHRIHASQNNPNAVASSANPCASAFFASRSV